VGNDMTRELILFYVFGGGAVLAALAMLLPQTGRNPIHAALYLIASLFCMAALYAVLAAHLLSALQIIVYAGAVMVLFTFVIMLLNVGPDDIPEAKISLPKIIGGALALFIFGKVLTALQLVAANAKSVDLLDPEQHYDGFGSIKIVGRMLYTTFMVPFELTSVLLLVAAVGAVVLAKRNLHYIERPEPTPAVFNREHHQGHDPDADLNDEGHVASAAHDSHGDSH